MFHAPVTERRVVLRNDTTVVSPRGTTTSADEISGIQTVVYCYHRNNSYYYSFFRHPLTRSSFFFIISFFFFLFGLRVYPDSTNRRDDRAGTFAVFRPMRRMTSAAVTAVVVDQRQNEHTRSPTTVFLR